MTRGTTRDPVVVRHAMPRGAKATISGPWCFSIISLLLLLFLGACTTVHGSDGGKEDDAVAGVAAAWSSGGVAEVTHGDEQHHRRRLAQISKGSARSHAPNVYHTPCRGRTHIAERQTYCFSPPLSSPPSQVHTR